MAEEAEEISLQFVVEDGTCVSNANSYISLEDAIQYQTNKGRTEWLALSDEVKKASIIKGTQYVDSQFTWRGRRKFQNQELAFPRVMLRDLDGFPVEGIPRCLKEAVLEAAYYGYKATVDLFTVKNSNGNIKSQRVEGAVQIEFYDTETSQDVIEYISKYASLNQLLKGLYDDHSKTRVSARANWGW